MNVRSYVLTIKRIYEVLRNWKNELYNLLYFFLILYFYVLVCIFFSSLVFYSLLGVHVQVRTCWQQAGALCTCVYGHSFQIPIRHTSMFYPTSTPITEYILSHSLSFTLSNSHSLSFSPLTLILSLYIFLSLSHILFVSLTQINTILYLFRLVYCTFHDDLIS